VIEWARERLADRGVAITGAPERVHDRPWSQVWRLPTARGALFVKWMFAPSRYEVPVTTALASWAPDLVTAVIDADPERSFLLMDDAGERLRAIIARDEDITRWLPILPRYAELQRICAPHASELVALGAPDRRASALPPAFESLVSGDELLTIAGAQSSTAAELGALRALIPTVREWCAQLAGTIPDTIQHDDLHDGQVFIREGVARVLDWGDSNVSHPFFSLVVLERAIGHALGYAPDAPELLRLRDAYLEPFSTLATRAQIDACLPVALRVGRLCRLLTWVQVVRGLEGPDREAEAVPGWVQLFLEPDLHYRGT
jgi:hypothetical protein